MNIINKIYENNNGDGYDGFVIETDSGKIEIFIDNFQDCCEEWGYLVSEEKEFEYFYGSKLKGVYIVESNDLSKDVSYVGEGGAVFVNVETSLGQIQFSVYNYHNGYYSHEVKVTVYGVDIVNHYI